LISPDSDIALRVLRLVDGLSRRGKQALMALWDLVSGIACIWAAFSLRLGTIDPSDHVPWIDLMIPALLVPPIFWAMGLYREITRYIGVQYVWRLVKACVVVALALEAALFISPDRYANIPWRSPIMAALLLWGAAGGARLMVRSALRQRMPVQHRVAILGASDVGAGLGAALSHDRMSELVAFFDDAPTLRGGSLRGVRIYPTDAFDDILKRERFDSLLVALGPSSRSKRRALLEHAAARGVRVLSVPTLAEIKDGRVSVSSLRPLSIEDLLGRPPVTPIPELLGADVVGKTVLVTGAGGSIGSELCRQVLALGPKALILVDNGEFNLFEIDRQLHDQLSAHAPGSVRPMHRRYLASVTDAVRIDQVMAEHRPDTIYHAAAYKHVPLVEDNEPEGAEVNVLGTLRVAEAAMRHGVKSFVLVSTDKAVRPSSVMGGTKRMAEVVLQALQAEYGTRHATRFTMVRFGNVLGSSGSVVPIFRRQIEQGGPVTVTHPEVTRYFMSIPEAVQLILQAGAMGQGGEVFVLDMGEPVRIADLARNMIRLAGRTIRDAQTPGGDVEIAFTGLRPGEKMFEELVIGDGIEKTRHPGILRASEGFLAWKDLEPVLQRLEAAVSQHDAAQVRQLVAMVASGGRPATGSPDAGLQAQLPRPRVLPDA
jgi:FlaA1/EpsC-like NDP-sugar epimerase